MKHLILATPLLFLSAPVEAFEWHVGVTFDHGKVVVGSDRVGVRVGYPETRHERRDRRHRHRERRPYYVIYPSARTAPPEEPEAIEEAKAAPAIESKPIVERTLLDPKGAARRHRARGATGARPWSVGEFLPPNVPHVKLSADSYDLPPEPSGQIYARVKGGIYLIDPVTRRVEAVVNQ